MRAIDWRGGWPRLGDPLSGSREPGRGPAFMKIVNRNSGALLDTPSCGFEGADIRLGADRRSPCARWRIEDRGDGWSSLNNQLTNKVAEAAGCATANGADVRQWGWVNNDCQRFRFVPTGDGFVRIENERSGRVLDAGGLRRRRRERAAVGLARQRLPAVPARARRARPAPRDSTSAAAGAACRWDFRHTSSATPR